MKDVILEEFFKIERWTAAIDKAVDKDINRALLCKLVDPEVRAHMYNCIVSGNYVIAPPHTAQIPKDSFKEEVQEDGTIKKLREFRTVFVNEPVDRIFLSIVNDMLFDLMPEMLHPRCKSYIRGTGCGKVVQEASRRICKSHGETIGFKSDLSKYFDSVPIRFIDEAFDKVEHKYGHSAIIDIVRNYYHSDGYFDEDNNFVEKYQSLKQGCAVASWLADVVIYHIDEKLNGLGGFYVRYSDDMLFIGDKYETAKQILDEELRKMDMKLNPKKVEYLSDAKWFKFLGFEIKGSMISLGDKRIKTFQKEIEDRTINRKDNTIQKAISSVNNYLYRGNGEFSWATSVLSIVNVEKDMQELNKFMMDAVRAVHTKKKKIGGLGFNRFGKDGCISRGIGRNVKSNRAKTGDELPGLLSIVCAMKAIKTSKPLFDVIVAGKS